MTKPSTKTAMAVDLAARISAHLQRFENDPVINGCYLLDENGERRPASRGLIDYWEAHACHVQQHVQIKYLSWQVLLPSATLSIEEAARYLAWLDAGGVGQHHQAFHELSDMSKNTQPCLGKDKD